MFVPLHYYLYPLTSPLPLSPTHHPPALPLSRPLTCSAQGIKDIALAEPLVDVVDQRAIVTNHVPILTIDVLTCKKVSTEQFGSVRYGTAPRTAHNSPCVTAL